MLTRRSRPIAPLPSREVQPETEKEVAVSRRCVGHAPSRFALTDLNLEVSATAPSVHPSAATREDKENQSIHQRSYTIDFGDKGHNLAPPPAVAAPAKASDASIAPFLDAAKSATTVFTRAAALKAFAAEKREDKLALARHRKMGKRGERAEERRMTGKLLVKASSRILLSGLKGDDPKYEAMLRDDLADPHLSHASLPQKWAGKTYHPEVGGMNDAEKVANASSMKEAHKAGDKYCNVKGLGLPSKGVRYYRDNCPSESIKSKGGDPRFKKFSPADFSGPAYYGAYFEEYEKDEVDPVVKDVNLSKSVRVVEKVREVPLQTEEGEASETALQTEESNAETASNAKEDGDEKASKKAKTTKPAPLHPKGVPTYQISTPFAFRYIK